MRELESVSSTTQAPEDTSSDTVDTSTDTDSKTNSDDDHDTDLALAACTGWTVLSSNSISVGGLYCQRGDVSSHVTYRCNSDTRTGILLTSCRDNFDRKLAPAVIPTGAPIRQLAPAVIPTGAPIRQLAGEQSDRLLTSIPTGAPMRELAGEESNRLLTSIP